MTNSKPTGEGVDLAHEFHAAVSSVNFRKAGPLRVPLLGIISQERNPTTIDVNGLPRIIFGLFSLIPVRRDYNAFYEITTSSLLYAADNRPSFGVVQLEFIRTEKLPSEPSSPIEWEIIYSLNPAKDLLLPSDPTSPKIKRGIHGSEFKNRREEHLRRPATSQREIAERILAITSRTEEPEERLDLKLPDPLVGSTTPDRAEIVEIIGFLAQQL
jgi:hypothetical protein